MENTEEPVALTCNCQSSCDWIHAFGARLQLVHVSSTNVLAAGLSEDDGCLVVLFRDGRGYAYRQADGSDLDQLLSAPSAGKYVYRNLSGTCEFLDALQGDPIEESWDYCVQCPALVDDYVQDPDEPTCPVCGFETIHGYGIVACDVCGAPQIRP